jgi:hypothetical protein
MKRSLTIAIVGLLMCVGTWWILNGGARKVEDRYARMDFARKRSLVRSVQSVAALFERDQRIPPKGRAGEIQIDSVPWGYPIQYDWENGVAVVRAAGRDGILHTEDDITSVVKLKKTK